MNGRRVWFVLMASANFLVAGAVRLPRGEWVVHPAATAAAVAENEELRIASVGPAVTEIVFALGLERSVVAVDSASTYPRAARQKAQVGYFRAISAEGVLSRRPNLILLSADAGPAHAIEQLRSTGIPTVVLPAVREAGAIPTLVRQIGDWTGHTGAAAALAQQLANRIQQLRERANSVTMRPRVLVVFAPTSGTVLVGGEESVPAQLVRLAGGENAASSSVEMAPLSAEGVLQAAPDIIVATEHTLSVLDGGDGLWQLPGLSRTPAGRTRKLFVAPDVGVLSLGPTFVRCAAALYEVLHAGAQSSRCGEEHGRDA
ncbi:MAG: hypothetical protein KatS3mg077_2200 [Candidatus Binatia bacterium]|nr:MAG: hypothetical protein KatS3mg077_2200 [Candidatus Binatia bacterium]